MFTFGADFGCDGKLLFLADLSALGEFFPRDYTGLGVRQQFRHLDIEGFEKRERSRVGCRDAETTASSVYLDFCRAQRLELIQSLLHRDVQRNPGLTQIPSDQ